MKKSSANLIALGQRELRAMGDKCDPACFVWYGCANSKPDGICAGFDLLDGETRRHLHKLLSEDDGKYVVNCVRMLQNGSNEEGLVQEVLRCLPELHQETQRREGFSYMAKCALGVSDASDQDHAEPERQPTSEFTRMLEAARGKGEQPHTVIERVIQTNPEDIIPREGGVVTMFERVIARRTNDEPEPIETRDLSTYRVPYGFSEMIEAAFPHGNRTTPEDKPHVVRGMGFAAMLEGARRGTE